LGMICLACGRLGEQREFLNLFADTQWDALAFTYKERREPRLNDYQGVGGGYDKSDYWQFLCVPKKTDGSPAGAVFGNKIIQKDYIQDMTFAVIMEIPDELLEEISQCLQFPQYATYLGRKCCTPSEFVFQGIFSDEESAQKKAQEIAVSKELRKFDETRDCFSIPKVFGLHKEYSK